MLLSLFDIVDRCQQPMQENWNRNAAGFGENFV